MIHLVYLLALAALLVALAVFAVSRIRLRRLVDLERIRTQIAADLHDEIGSSLSRMAVLSEAARQRPGATDPALDRTLDELARTARDLVDTMSDVVWSIDPKRDDLRHVLSRARRFASDVWDAKGIVWTFETPPDPAAVRLAPEQRRHLYLVLKEAITNVATHSACTHASLHVAVDGDILTAEVRDDGRGMDTALVKEPSTSQRRGRGLVNMIVRAASVGGRVAITSAPREGMRIVMTMPLRQGSMTMRAGKAPA